MKLRQTLLILSLCSYSWLAEAQLRTPAASPAAKSQQTVGLTDITVEYSRPSKRGRTVFGSDGLVPLDNIWRTGANAVTKITFSGDVKVEGKELKAGSYGILTKPGASTWAVHFYTYESSNWASYVEKEPAAAVMVNAQTNPLSLETFTIHFDALRNDGATMLIAWDNVIVPVRVVADPDATVMAQIDRMIAGPSAGDYYAAGSYLHDTGKDLNKALMYVQKATKSDNPMFWQLRKESLILADMGRKADAIAAAKQSLELAKKAGNDDYIRMNEKSIAEWSK